MSRDLRFLWPGILRTEPAPTCPSIACDRTCGAGDCECPPCTCARCVARKLNAARERLAGPPEGPEQLRLVAPEEQP